MLSKLRTAVQEAETRKRKRQDEREALKHQQEQEEAARMQLEIAQNEFDIANEQYSVFIKEMEASLVYFVSKSGARSIFVRFDSEVGAFQFNSSSYHGTPDFSVHWPGFYAWSAAKLRPDHVVRFYSALITKYLVQKLTLECELTCKTDVLNHRFTLEWQ